MVTMETGYGRLQDMVYIPVNTCWTVYGYRTVIRILGCFKNNNLVRCEGIRAMM